ncbi:hypothetical protein HPC37_02920 [Pasteurellaceae bacterium 20609_3]|uniref:hypothetical protein n=1 Tax=Spirabiliibacterium mucosae TaxID=28156 RepID=UPI001AAD24DA|nr:hypothetical protein [Spirabiliibacterium mucosae]MBE2897807.1 hypothetical protein [Spirabiliibacterium mucosae]
MIEINEQFLRDALANGTALKTRNGEKVKLIHITNRDTPRPVVGYIGDCELPSTWTSSGGGDITPGDDIVGAWEEPSPATGVTYGFVFDAFLNDKPVKTRDGRKARVTCLDKDAICYPFLGYVGDDRCTWCDNGRFEEEDVEHGLDIIGPWEEKPVEFTYDMLLDAFKNDRALRTRGGNEVRIIQVDRGEIPFQCDNGVWYAQTGAACIYTWTTENDLVGYWEDE